MSARGGLFLGDLVKAVSLLHPRDRATAVAMARLVGLGPGGQELLVPAGLTAGPASVADAALAGPEAEEPPPSPASAAAAAADRPAPVGAVASGGDAVPEQAVPDEMVSPPLALAERPAPALRLRERPVAFSLALTRPPSEDRHRPATGRTDDGTGEVPGESSGAVRSAGLEPPWTPEWARGVMVAAVSAPVASRRLDQRALVRKVSRQQVLRAVPWQRRPSTRRGVQLLLDHSPGMVPFHDDRRWLHGLMASVAGRDRVEVLRFSGSPRRGVVHVGSSAGPQAYRAPAPGTPVVLVSDLGMLRPPLTGDRTARVHEWLDFLDQVLRCGCPPTCLTPFPATAYLPPVRDRVALIPFDRRISLRHAREATRKIHRLLEERS
ncbi:hypothetical protein ACFWWT_09520 [Streptomyces sp. NPDC058676]|uniref:hypothetical protein n=1 Tax=unclassified Streptomyces TaxID=2593676 RepID=UPI00364F98A7